jgi:hypothetical protein
MENSIGKINMKRSDDTEFSRLHYNLWIRHGFSISLAGSQQENKVSAQTCLKIIKELNLSSSYCYNSLYSKIKKSTLNIDQDSEVVYQWFKNDLILPEQNKQILSLKSPSFSDEGRYSCFRFNLTAPNNAVSLLAYFTMKISGK